MMKLSKSSGYTLAEVLVASILIGLVFVIVATLYASSVKLLKNEVSSHDVDALLAFETISRNINLAEDVGYDANDPGQIQLRIDINPDNGLSRDADNRWISYRFIGGRLRTETVEPPNAVAANVDGDDEEVIPGLEIDDAQSRFDLVDPSGQGQGRNSVVEFQMVIIGHRDEQGNQNQQSRTLLTRVALRRGK